MKRIFGKNLAIALAMPILSSCGFDGPCLIDYARGSITTVPGLQIDDGDLFTLLGGLKARTFQFDKDGTVLFGDAAVTISDASTAEDVRNAIISSINNEDIGITASVSGSSNVVDLQNDIPGSHGNIGISENVSDPGFITDGMSGGCP